jgi:hypothetical protein
MGKNPFEEDSDVQAMRASMRPYWTWNLLPVFIRCDVYCRPW